MPNYDSILDDEVLYEKVKRNYRDILAAIDSETVFYVENKNPEQICQNILKFLKQ